MDAKQDPEVKAKAAEVTPKLADDLKGQPEDEVKQKPADQKAEEKVQEKVAESQERPVGSITNTLTK